MKSFMKEFKEFAMQGNVMDLAIGMIIGAAFTAIINSLVENILSPLIGIFFKMDFSALSATVRGAEIMYGKFIMAIIDFIIVALVLFFLIKGMNKMIAGRNKSEDGEPTTKECPFCKSEIALEATRCPHCTSELK